MSKTYLYCLLCIALYIVVVRPVNENKVDTKFDKPSKDNNLSNEKEQTIKNPTYTI